MTDQSPEGIQEDPDNAYGALIEANDDSRWAFGTGFDDPLTGMDVAVADGIDASRLGQYCLMLADDALVLAQRLTEWATHAPELEEEVALANIGLDLLGQARLLLGRAATANPGLVPQLPEGSPVPAEDRLTFFRDPFGFANISLVEYPNGDFAVLIARLLIFSSWRLELLHDLSGSADEILAGIAQKAIKEVSYHRDYADRWFVTLARGTDTSRQRMIEAVSAVWPYADELAQPHEVETRLREQGVSADPADAWRRAGEHIDAVLAAAALERPEVRPAGPLPGRSGRDGFHSEYLGRLLDEMQSVARTHPMARW
jgi:ring-1,2-phenylacetyl-CoA epoxidase subunit PaaC